jgi:hypothetical protein
MQVSKSIVMHVIARRAGQVSGRQHEFVRTQLGTEMFGCDKSVTARYMCDDVHVSAHQSSCVPFREMNIVSLLPCSLGPVHIEACFLVSSYSNGALRWLR